MSSPHSPARSARSGREGERDSLGREQIVDAAQGILESDGAAGLTMRKLAAELGVAVTSIYWHIGNRDDLLDAIIDAELAGWKSIRPVGSDPPTRIVSVARQMRKRLLGRRAVIELASERGRIFEIFVPSYEVLAGEFLAGGLADGAAALAVRTLQLHVIGSVVLQRRSERERAPEGRPRPTSTRAAKVAQRALTISSAEAFEAATGILVGGLIQGGGTR